MKIDVMQAIITIISLLFGMIVTLRSLRSSEKEAIKSETSVSTEMMIKLETINNNLIEFKSELTNLKDEVRDDHDRLIRIESQCTHCKFGEIVTHVTELP